MRKQRPEALVPEAPSSQLQACVVLPARNEEELLPAALHALAEQKTLEGKPLPHDAYEILLLINNSIDRTRCVAESFQRLYPSLRLHVLERNFGKSHAHIGHVRRLLMDEACRRLETLGRCEGLILSTDSDSRVAPNWICRNSDEIARGAQAVGGRIVVLPCELDAMHPMTLEIYRQDHLYRRLVSWVEDRCDPEPHDPWPRHYQHFGASLAITPRAYRAAGRMPPRRYLEDVAFYNALLRHDIRLRHSNRVRVFTAGRLKGRTRFGLSRQLKDWQAPRKRLPCLRVESARFLAELFQTRRQLRRLWLDRPHTTQNCRLLADDLAAALGVSAQWLVDRTQAARYFGLLLSDVRFYERFRKMWPNAARLEKLERAVQELRIAFEAAHPMHRRSVQLCAI
ncbi:MAG TPA: glycosyltransferase [Bryobacteraceae bacterium]|jgi:hypothetical protein|nr:glycosyltransferase [Bryobacteraceae bacterium]